MYKVRNGRERSFLILELYYRTYYSSNSTPKPTQTKNLSTFSFSYSIPYPTRLHAQFSLFFFSSPHRFEFRRLGWGHSLIFPKILTIFATQAPTSWRFTVLMMMEKWQVWSITYTAAAGLASETQALTKNRMSGIWTKNATNCLIIWAMS